MLPAAARPLWGPCLGLRGAALRLARLQVPGVCAARQMRSSSHRRGEALAGAPLDNAPKEYPPKIQQLVQDIASLTLLEISDLNELLKKTLKIQDVGLMPMGGVVPGAVSAAAAPEVAEEDVPKQKERTHFTVRLTEAKPVDKVKLIKEIKNHVQDPTFLTLFSGRRRSWWSPCPRKSKPTSPKLRPRRSRPPWKPWAAPWFWSSLQLEDCVQGPWDAGGAPPTHVTRSTPGTREWGSESCWHRVARSAWAWRMDLL
uniref:Mitochondrial ribosomal protein L12 n=1 Tax=Prolemur simus TaxID=1328070 RepID=A0A8C8ZLH9_PROSS